MTDEQVRERILSKIAIDNKTGCWNWTGAHSRANGTGRIRYGGTVKDAHKVSYIVFVGPVKPGLHLHHICANRRCVNPDHLLPVTPREHFVNLSPRHMAYDKARRTHCPLGHPLVPGNLVVPKWERLGQRECLICHRAKVRESYRRKLLRESST